MSRFVIGATSPTEYADFRIKQQKRCIRCGLVMDAGQFPLYAYVTAQGKQSYRLDSRCKACQSVRRKARRARNLIAEVANSAKYWADNRDRLCAKTREYRAANVVKVRRQRVISEQKRRLRGYNACVKGVREITNIVLELARIDDRYLDAYTGELIDRPTIDHIVPLNRGGQHVLENLCVTSRANNISKHQTPLLVWLAKRPLQ